MKHCQKAHNPFVGCESSPKLCIRQICYNGHQKGFCVSGKEFGFLKKAIDKGSTNNAGQSFKFINLDMKHPKAGQPFLFESIQTNITTIKDSCLIPKWTKTSMPVGIFLQRETKDVMHTAFGNFFELCKCWAPNHHCPSFKTRCLFCPVLKLACSHPQISTVPIWGGQFIPELGKKTNPKLSVSLTTQCQFGEASIPVLKLDENRHPVSKQGW
jgi:hypothetical protein